MNARLLPRLLLALSLGTACLAQAAELTVSAAASLSNAFKDIAPMFEAAHPGTQVRLNFAASGVLLQQMAKGAPVDVFASADQETMDQAQAKQLVKPGQRRDFAANRLVLIVPAASTRVPRALNELSQPGYARIAIGLPASVPVGRYTKGVLEAAGLWAALEPKMVGGTNVRQVLDYVQRGEVDAGFVYATDAALMPDKLKLALNVPTATPIRYPVAPVSAGPNAAMGERFVDFLFTPAARAVLTRHGFHQP